MKHYRYKRDPDGYCLTREQWVKLWQKDISHKNLDTQAYYDYFEEKLKAGEYDLIDHNGYPCFSKTKS